MRNDAFFTPTGITSEAGSSAAITDHVVVVRRCCEWLSVLPHSDIALPGRLLGGPDPARMTLHSNAKPPTSRSTRLATKEQRLVLHADGGRGTGTSWSLRECPNCCLDAG
ncbi:hypothetical protein, partial [Mycobacterium sp.]|uniref:hypothetical protein n=1 Tax=Mycobacterium sp. TaxID=1785 RepID=UPI003C75C603